MCWHFFGLCLYASYQISKNTSLSKLTFQRPRRWRWFPKFRGHPPVPGNLRSSHWVTCWVDLLWIFVAFWVPKKTTVFLEWTWTLWRPSGNDRKRSTYTYIYTFTEKWPRKCHSQVCVATAANWQTGKENSFKGFNRTSKYYKLTQAPLPYPSELPNPKLNSETFVPIQLGFMVSQPQKWDQAWTISVSETQTQPFPFRFWLYNSGCHTWVTNNWDHVDGAAQCCNSPNCWSKNAFFICLTVWSLFS